MAGERGTVNVQPHHLTSRPLTVRRQRSIPLGVCIVRARQGSRGVHDKALGGIQALCEGLAVRLLIKLRGIGNCQLPEGTLKLRIVILPAIRAHLQPQAKLFSATDSRLAWSSSAAMPSHTWRVECTDLLLGNQDMQAVCARLCLTVLSPFRPKLQDPTYCIGEPVLRATAASCSDSGGAIPETGGCWWLSSAECCRAGRVCGPATF